MLWFVKTTTELCTRWSTDRSFPELITHTFQRDTGTGVGMLGHSYSPLISLWTNHRFYLYFLGRQCNRPWWVISMVGQIKALWTLNIHAYFVSWVFLVLVLPNVSCVFIISWLLGWHVHSSLSACNIHVLYLLTAQDYLAQLTSFMQRMWFFPSTENKVLDNATSAHYPSPLEYQVSPSN